MFLEDSFELETVPSSNDVVELLPMLQYNDIKLSDIWIPSELINRQCRSYDFQNEHRSAVHHTLVKHEVLDSLSIYSEPSISQSNFSSTEKLLDSLEVLPQTCQNENNHFNNDEEEYSDFLEHTSDCVNTIQSNVFQSNEQESEAFVEKNCDSSNSSTVDYLEHLNISDDEVEASSARNFDKSDNLETPVRSDDELNALKLIESSNDKTNDVQVKSDPCSLNEEHIQDNNVSQDFETQDLFELSEKIWNDTMLENEKASKSDDQVTSQNTDDMSEIKDTNEEISVQEFPFILQKSQIEDPNSFVNNGKQSKKEKKGKKKSTKNIPLDNFFVTKEEYARSDNPEEFLQFCESLRQKSGFPNVSEKDKFTKLSTFPSLVELNQIDECDDLENEINSKDFTTNPVLDSQSLDCDINPSEMESDATKYIIENIPLHIKEVDLYNILLCYGEVIQLRIEKSGKTLKASIMIIVEDPNWLIECLNGDQPFGAASGEGLKCYQIL